MRKIFLEIYFCPLRLMLGSSQHNLQSKGGKTEWPSQQSVREVREVNCCMKCVEMCFILHHAVV